eukprot:164050_1
MTLNRTVPTLTSYHQFSSTNTELSNASIVDNINVDFGVFGRHILSEYCGSTITTKFYSPSHNIDTNLLDTEDVDIYGMLLTEEQMGRIALENIVLFIAFTFLSITIQTIFALYFKSCKTGCDNYYLQREIANETNGDQSLEEKTKCCESFVDSQTARNTDRCSKCCMGILALLVLVHLCVSMHEYYTFVDHEVQYDDLLTNYSYMGHEYKYALESCNDDGIGLISCPALFCDHDDNGHCLRITNEEGYDIEEAQHICSWVFYMLIIANPTVFQYSLLASIVFLDTIAYLLILFMTSICPAICCTCSSWCLCMFGCCIRCHSCVPQPKSCCHENICCHCHGANCCYCCCGLFGPFWMFLNFVFTFILMAILLFFVGASFIIAAVMVSCISLIWREAFSIASKSRASLDGIELTVRTARSKSSDPQVSAFSITKRRSIFSIFRQFRCRDLTKLNGLNANDLKKMSSIISLLVPLVLIYAIALVQSFVSIFIVYYVVDGEVFMAWNYYKPIGVGMYDYCLSAYDLITHPDELWLFVQNIILGISWKSLFSFSLEYFSSFKVTVLLLRSVLLAFIGIIEASISLT